MFLPYRRSFFEAEGAPPALLGDEDQLAPSTRIRHGFFSSSIGLMRPPLPIHTPAWNPGGQLVNDN